MLARIVIAVSEPALRKKLRKAVVAAGGVADSVREGEGLWQRLARESADVILVDRDMIPHPAAETLGTLHQLPESPEIVVISDAEDAKRRASFLAVGCSAVVNPELRVEDISEVLGALIAKRSEAVEQSLAIRTLDEPQLSDFVSVSPAMQRFMGVVQRVVAGKSSLLILGETGAGKERLARAVHAGSPRASGPFVAVNCGALPEGLLESELFGHEKGAFTGATRSRKGCFELAHRGTIFLDEIGDMPLHLQVKLLRVLQDRSVQRVGGERSLPVDVRIMAASNRELAVDVEDGSFRRDLYYRLGVVTLTIPPLRERREDIPTLVESYVNYLRPKINVDVTSVSPEAVEALRTYSWPGNVRELVNVVERAMLLCGSDEIDLADLPEEVSGRHDLANDLPDSPESGAAALALPAGWQHRPWKEVRAEVLERLERVYLASLLKATGGRVGETARLAGMDSRSLYEKMKMLHLRKEAFRKA